MSKRTVTFIQCDGCLRHGDDIEIVDTKRRTAIYGDERTVDIRADCSAQNKYICLACRLVHDDEHMCEVLKEER